MIPFNEPCFIGKELEYMKKAVESKHISGRGEFSKKVSKLMEKNLTLIKSYLHLPVQMLWKWLLYFVM